MADILELARFKAAEGAAVVAAARSMDAWLARQPGFVSRVLVGPDDEGVYTDVVRWRDLDSAHAAMGAVMQSEEASRFMAAVDPSSVQMVHLAVAHES